MGVVAILVITIGLVAFEEMLEFCQTMRVLSQILKNGLDLFH